MRWELALAALLALTSCTAVREPGPRWRGGLPDAAELVRSLEARRSALRSLRSVCRVTITGPEGTQSSRQVLLVQRPDSLRAEAFSLLGTGFVLAAAGGRLAVYVRGENRVYRGAASRENLAHYAHLDLTVADAVDLLLGGPPYRGAERLSVSWDPEARGPRLVAEDGDGALGIAFAGDLRIPVRVERYGRSGELEWRAAFSEHLRVRDLWVPSRIAIEIPRRREAVAVKFEGIEANPELAPALFALQNPPGSEEVELDTAVD
jgi:hypothetical protein